MNKEDSKILASLTNAQRFAVKRAFKEWVRVAQEQSYTPLAEWKNFLVEVDHSALLQRLLEGERPFKKKPPLSHSYPNYTLMEQLESPLEDWTTKY